MQPYDPRVPGFSLAITPYVEKFTRLFASVMVMVSVACLCWVLVSSIAAWEMPATQVFIPMVLQPWVIYFYGHIALYGRPPKVIEDLDRSTEESDASH